MILFFQDLLIIKKLFKNKNIIFYNNMSLQSLLYLFNTLLLNIYLFIYFFCIFDQINAGKFLSKTLKIVMGPNF